MSVLKKNSARQRDQERARLIWLLTTDKAVTSTLLGKLTLAEQYDVGTLADDIAEVGALVAHLPPPDLADTLEALPSEERHALWRLVQDHERGQVLLEASENVWDDLIDEMSDRDILDALQTLDIDEQIYLVQHLPRNLTGRLLASLPAEERARVRQVMHYEKNSVGAIVELASSPCVRTSPWGRCSAIFVAWAVCRTTPINCSSPRGIKPCSGSWS